MLAVLQPCCHSDRLPFSQMSPPMQNSATNPGPRPRGRPKGSKNGPNAGAVGRPRKNGQPPNKKGHTIGMHVSHLLGDRFSTEFGLQFLPVEPHFPHWHRLSHHLRLSQQLVRNRLKFSYITDYNLSISRIVEQFRCCTTVDERWC